MRALIIGDVHVRVEDLDDCDHLAAVVLQACEQEKPDIAVILGDLYDGFASKNVVVERWWQGFLGRIPLAPIDKYILVGNHDRPGDSSQAAHALQSHHRDAIVVESYRPLGDGVVALPFYFKAEDFVAAANNEYVAQAKTLFCHQSFIGAQFESGQPIEAQHDASAVDPSAIPQKCIVAGHVHSPQNFGKVWYPGSPRWRNNVSDCLPNGNERYVYALDFEGGLPKAIRKYATGAACRRMWQVKDVEDEPLNVPIEPMKDGDRIVVDVIGSEAYIEQRKAAMWTMPGVRVRPFRTDRPGPKLSESDGVQAAWNKWTGDYKPKFGTSTDVLSKLARERLSL